MDIWGIIITTAIAFTAVVIGVLVFYNSDNGRK